MKRHDRLFEKFYALPNLYLATKNAQKAKRYKESTALFNLNLEQNLIALQAKLRSGTYEFGDYHSFYVFDPKRRLISAAPYADRVVHHAVCNIIEPIFERIFIHDLYSNRTGKGTHKAVDRYQKFCRLNKFVLKCDIKKYFASIDKEMLYIEIVKKISDHLLLAVIKKIIYGFNPRDSKGIPIGNLTSQYFANIYLNRMDYFIKEVLGCRHYIRYVDDFVVFDNSKVRLKEMKIQIENFLKKYHLELHSNKSHIRQTAEGVKFLGYRVFSTHRLLDKSNIKRFKRRLKKIQILYKNNQIDLNKTFQRLNSWNSHASHANTYRLREKIFKEAIFQKG